MKNKKAKARGDKFFYVLVTLILTVFFLLVLYPCIFVISASFSSGDAVTGGKVLLWPVEFSLEGYKAVFSNPNIWSGYANSIFYTVAGTAINIAMTMTCGYAMSRQDLPGRKFFTVFFVFTMYFSGGMIPGYILIRNLGMVNTRWVMIIPQAMSVYNMIVAKTFIMSNIPKELLEAAQIDGCSDSWYFFKVVLPLSKAVTAVMVLFYGVGHWNSFFTAMIYLYDKDKFPLTIWVRQLLLLDQIDASNIQDPELLSTLTRQSGVLKYALIIVASCTDYISLCTEAFRQGCDDRIHQRVN